MSSTSTIEMDRAQWLAARQKGIGGSDAAAVCGVSRYKTPLQLWQEKTGRVQPPDLGDNSRVRAGNALEEVVAVWWQEETGMACRRDNKIRAAKDRPYLLANVDRVIQSNGFSKSDDREFARAIRKPIADRDDAALTVGVDSVEQLVQVVRSYRVVMQRFEQTGISDVFLSKMRDLAETIAEQAIDPRSWT